MFQRPLRFASIAIGLSTLTACGGGQIPASAPSPPRASSALALPGATPPASMDYIVCDRARSRVWVPVGSTGSVDVLDVAKGTFTRIDGFKSAEREMRGAKRTIGPSSADVGGGHVFVGNRASSEVCPIDATTLVPGPCLGLSASPDGVAYVSPVKEVWVTTPREQSITVLDASSPDALKVKTTVKLDGAPEGYAVDEARGLFFTNLEDKGSTLVIDVRTHAVKATYDPGCGADGPRGLVFDASHDLLVVACTDHLQSLDAAHDGAPLGKLDTGAGVDNLDFLDGRHLVFAAAGKAARLTVARIDDKGHLSIVTSHNTAPGARNAVADADGNAYVPDSQGARLLVVPAAAK
jgi:hypothetical protein